MIKRRRRKTCNYRRVKEIDLLKENDDFIAGHQGEGTRRERPKPQASNVWEQYSQSTKEGRKNETSRHQALPGIKRKETLPGDKEIDTDKRGKGGGIPLTTFSL